MIITRISNILSELMNAKSPITSEYLANVIKVTSRTVRNDIKDLNNLLMKHGAVIKSVRGTGYELEINDVSMFKKLMEDVFQDESFREGMAPSSPEERVRYVITRLLLTNQYVKLEDLADEIYVSKSTILNDIRDVKSILKKYDIELQKRPNYGLRIKGDEVKLRYCMSEYVFNRKNSELEMLTERLALITKDEVTVIRSIIIGQIKEHEITLSDIALNNLMIHIAIACKRIRNGNYVSILHDELNEVMKQREYMVAKKISQQIESHLQVNFPETEIVYIAIHLLGTKLIDDHSTEATKERSYIGEDIINLVTEIISIIDEELRLGIGEDPELIDAMSLHLKPAINRYRFGMNLRNPMLNEIKSNYPLAFEAGIRTGMILREKLGIEIDENEIGYLALHIGVAIERNNINHKPKRCMIVCASGVGSARLLFYKLQSKFGSKLEIVGTTEYYKLQQLSLDNIDFLVSTIPIQQELQIPVIEVNTFLGSNDLEKIEAALKTRKSEEFEYTRKELVFLQEKFETKEEVLTFLGKQMQAQGLVDETFIDSVFEREALSPTCFGNFVAIPHPLTPKTSETFWAICTLQKPIQWADKRVQFICLLNVKQNSTDDLQKMYNLLGKVVDDTNIVQQLIKCKTYKELLNIFIKHS